MNKKFLVFFSILFILILTVGAVSAANLKEHNFGSFAIDIPKGADFEKYDNTTYEAGVKVVDVSYVFDDVVIEYVNSPMFSDNSSSMVFQMIFESLNPDLTKCYESQEDNLKILEPTSKDDSNFAVVGMSNGTKIIMLYGQDVKLLKEMGHSIEILGELNE